MEQFDGLKHYFHVNVSGKQPPTFHYKTYEKIFDQIKYKDILAKIHLVGAVADIFN